MGSQIVGKQSIAFQNAVYIAGSASVVGPKEAAGPLGEWFDVKDGDPLFGKETWEQAESEMQSIALQKAGGKSKTGAFRGAISVRRRSTGAADRDVVWKRGGEASAVRALRCVLDLCGIPDARGDERGRWLCRACSGCDLESLRKCGERISFPLGYGSQRPLAATWTVTGSGAFILGTKNGYVRISGVTPGKIVDRGVRDNMNMGACMAPAACDTICQNLLDFEREPQEYDRIITGDLGTVGKEILLQLVKDRGFDIETQYMDCGIEIYDPETQDTHAGGSGCGCAAVTLSAMILPKLRKGSWKRVLFVPTGALLSKVSFNEGQTIPGIAHAVVLEHV